MKYIITILSTILFISFAGAQNIVPNYSFEEDDSCPTNLNGRTHEYALGCVGWGQATSGNPDYYNACDTAAASIGREFPIVGVPHNILGYRPPYQGVAYVGINTYVSDGIPDYKEYLFADIPALDIDTVYVVTIHISLSSICEFATDGMGVLFTTYGSPSQYSDTTIHVAPQIDYTGYGVITDSINWTTLTSTFIADSAYTSLIIGGFKRVNEMNIAVVKDSSSSPPNDAYYYIDNVVVEKLSSTSLAKININDGVKIYPNPFTDHTTLLFNNPYNLPHSLSLYNAEGQIVLRQDNITSEKIRIDKNNLPSGFYYYQLSNQDNVVANGKLAIN